MLSPDHVRVRRQGSELKLLGLDRELDARAVVIAREVTDVAREHLGKTRDEVMRAWLSIECSPRERRILSGIIKLV